ncbi:hypothetical protein [Lyngbya aestuarii]|uniref:hypothetical protein n=1 Tax=Lyngbya aestuarii TaxID=118322 RepID=UPI00403D57F8
MPPLSTRKTVAQINRSQQPTPLWLRSLIFLQRSSELASLVLVGTTLTVYSWTVYTQQQWTREYSKLQTLQRHERHMTTANEVLKNQLAQQAESPATGLVNPTPDNTIFLQPAKERPSHSVPQSNSEVTSAAKIPLGY